MDIEDVFQAVRLNDVNLLRTFFGTFDINSLNEEGQSLLHEASAYNSLECAQELLNLGVDCDHKDKLGVAALHYCASNFSVDVAKIILEYGANVNINDLYGNEPLWTAVFNARGKYDLVKLLKDFKADSNHKNSSDKSPLDFAKKIGDEKLILILEN